MVVECGYWIKEHSADTFIQACAVRDKLYFMRGGAHLEKVYEDPENPPTDTLLLSDGPKQAKQAHFRDLLLRMRHHHGWKYHRGHYT